MKKFALAIIIIGIVFFSLPKISEWILLSKNNEIKIDQITTAELEKNAETGNKNYDASKISPIDVNGVILNREKADLSKVIGQLVIPSINKNIAIFDGLENNSLIYGACTMKPNQKMGLGNYSIAGHFSNNKNILFGGLMDIKTGDILKITNKKNIYEYEVFKTMKVSDDRLDLIQDSVITNSDGKAVLSLMTCYYDQDGLRYFVVGKFKNLYPYSESKMLEGIK